MKKFIRRKAFSPVRLAVFALLLNLGAAGFARAEDPQQQDSANPPTNCCPHHFEKQGSDLQQDATGRTYTVAVYKCSLCGALGSIVAEGDVRDQLPDSFNLTLDPIDTTTGNNIVTENRLYVPCPGIPLEVDLKYQSLTSQPQGMLGKGWLHSYEWFLEAQTNAVTVYTGDGRKFGFFKNPGGFYDSPDGNNWELHHLLSDSTTSSTNDFLNWWRVGAFSDDYSYIPLTYISSGSVVSNGYRLDLPGGEYYLFSEEGMLTQKADAWGNILNLTYDSNWCLTEVSHSNGRSIVFSNEWLSAVDDWRISSISVTGGESLYFAYNADGLFTQIVENVDAHSYTSSYQYDENGCLTNTVNGAGYESMYAYEEQPQADGSRRAVGLQMGSGYYEHMLSYVSSNVTDVIYFIRGRNVYYRYERDPETGKLLTCCGPSLSLENISDLGTRYVHAGEDLTEETQFDDLADEAFSRYMKYDDDHNVTELSVAYNSASPVLQMTAQYDPDWKLPTVMADAESNRVETVYTNGSPIRIRQFYSDTQSYDTAFGYYTNGLLAAATNANGHVTEYTYDANGCLATVAAELGPVVSNTCNSLGYVTRTELLAQDGSSSGRVTDFDPDAKGRVRRIDYADGTYATFAYNAIDYLTNTVDRAGHATDYTYAPTEKLTSVTRWLEQDGSNIPVRISYDYDQQFNTLFITEPRGRYVESYQLDVQDRITAVTNIEGQAMSIDYGVGDFVKKITRFDGSSITNTYDTVGRKETVSYLAPNNQQLSTINYTYYADSRPKTVSNSTTSVSNTYDRLNRLTAVRSQRTDVSVAGSTLNYGYDPVGNVTNATLTTDNDSQITSSYTYDSAERLTGISQSGSGILPLAFSYIYSPVNGRISSITNLESGIVTSYAYDIMDRATNIAYRTASGSLIRSLDYQYDALGMITNKTVSGGASSTSTAYQYDSINRLTSESLITDNGSQITGYAYDLAGNRTSVVSPTNQSQITNNYALGAGNRLAFWGATVPPSTTPPATPPTSFPAAERSGRCSGTNATASHLFYPRHPQFNTPTMSWAAPCA